jgi:phytoene dehydrogenase-like protein
MCQRGKEVMVLEKARARAGGRYRTAEAFPRKREDLHFDIEERNLKLEVKRAC